MSDVIYKKRTGLSEGEKKKNREEATQPNVLSHCRKEGPERGKYFWDAGNPMENSGEGSTAGANKGTALCRVEKGRRTPIPNPIHAKNRPKSYGTAWPSERKSHRLLSLLGNGLRPIL